MQHYIAFADMCIFVSYKHAPSICCDWFEVQSPNSCNISLVVFVSLTMIEFVTFYTGRLSWHATAMSCRFVIWEAGYERSRIIWYHIWRLWQALTVLVGLASGLVGCVACQPCLQLSPSQAKQSHVRCPMTYVWLLPYVAHADARSVTVSFVDCCLCKM